jgi:hypothetical protein
MKAFDETQSAVGVLIIGGNRIENVRSTVSYNDIDTSNLRAVLYSNFSDGDVMYRTPMADGEISFEALHGNYRFKWKGDIFDANVNEMSDEFATVCLATFTTVQLIEDQPVTEISFTFYVNESQLFERRLRRTRHHQYGLLFGWNGEGTSPHWKTDELAVKEEDWEVNIARTNLFRNHEDKKDASLIKEHLRIDLKIAKEVLEFDTRYEEGKAVAESYIRMMSLLECREIGWTLCAAGAYNGNTPLIRVTEYRRFVSRNYTDDNYVLQATDAYRTILPNAARSYRGLESDTRNFIDKLVDRYLLIGREDIHLDTRLTHAQTLLEMIVLTVPEAVRESGFSRKLVVAVEQMGVEWRDVFAYIDREDIFSNAKKNFLMVDIRNALLHDGMMPATVSGYELLQETDRTKMLARRLISKKIGFDLPEIDFKRPSITITKTSPTPEPGE